MTAGSGSPGDRLPRAARPALLAAMREAGSGVVEIYVDPEEPGRNALSMKPHLRPGDAVGWCRTDGGLVRGDLALYADPDRDGILVVHRVVGGSMEPPGLTTKGDARPEEDAARIDAGALVGRVAAMRRRGVWFDLDSGAARRYGRVVAALSSWGGGAFGLLARFDRAVVPSRDEARPPWVFRRLAWWGQSLAIGLVEATLFRVCHRRLGGDEVAASFDREGGEPDA